MPDHAELTALDRALEITRAVPVHPKAETVRLEDALGRVLAREVRSLIDSPPFDKSSMDGFAVRAAETASRLRVTQTIAAGGTPAGEVRPGETVRIMTGAMLPPGAGRVIRKEYVREEDGFIVVRTPEAGDNVIRRAANLAAGSTVVHRKVITAADIGTLAASGVDRVEAAVRPRILVVCTGPELRQPGEPLRPGEIYDSNGAQLRAQLAALKCSAEVRSGVPDSPGPLSELLAGAEGRADVILLTGGISAGDFDYVPACLRQVGAEILFHRVSVRPGRPTLFARRGEQFFFGLPGNPVSTFVIFEVFVKPFLYRMMGLDWSPPLRRGTLAHDLRRVEKDRTEFLPVRMRAGQVQAVPYHGSAHVNALAEADGLLRVEIGVTMIEAGTAVDVLPV